MGVLGKEGVCQSIIPFKSNILYVYMARKGKLHKNVMYK